MKSLQLSTRNSGICLLIKAGIVFLGLLLSLSVAKGQTTYYVDAQNGSDNNGSGTQSSPWKSIDKAHTNASDGDTIDITGTFDWTSTDQHVTGYLTISQDLTIRGQGADQTTVKAGPKPTYWGGSGSNTNAGFNVFDATVTFKKLSIINMTTNPAILSSSSNYNSDITLNRVNIKHGYDHPGIKVDGTGSITIKNSTIHHNYNTSNTGSGKGGGVYIGPTFNATITNSTIAHNEADYRGAGIYIEKSTITVTNCMITHNNAKTSGDGPGIFFDNVNGNNHNDIYLKNNLIAKNKTNGTSLTTHQYDFFGSSSNTTKSDNGGNVFGHIDDGASGGLTVNSESWYDYDGSNTSNGTYNEKGSSQTGSLYLSSSLASNNSNYGTKTLAVDNSKSIVIDEGQSGANNGVNIPSNDQRGKSRITQLDIGPFEWQLAQPDNNNALDFDGGNGYVEYGNGSDMLDGESGITIEGWVKISTNSKNDGAGDGFFGIRDENVADFYIMEYQNDIEARFRNSSGTEWTFTKPINFGIWQHYALVRNGTTLKLYVQGKQVAQNTSVGSANISATNVPFTIGRMTDDISNTNYAAGFDLEGRLDEVRVWSEARTKVEIRENMCKTLKGTETNLEAYYRLDKTTGTTAPDLTANNNDGTLNNMTASGSGNDWVSSASFTTWQGDEGSGWSNSGNWSNGTPASVNNVGIYNLSYAGFQKPDFSGNPTIQDLVIGPSASPNINSDFTVSEKLFLQNTLPMNGNTLTINDDAEVFPAGGASGQYISGTVKKKGDDQFTFPLGDGGRYARLEISAPGNVTDAFSASYNNSSYSNTSSFASQANNPSTNAKLNNVSTTEYWTLNRTNGSSSVDVTLYWEDGSQSGSNISNINELVIAHWNSSNNVWENLDRSSTTGSKSSGSITVNGVSNFSPFTFGSTSTNDNPLPVELLSFHALVDEDHVDLNWVTASETNNSHFIVQKRVEDEWENIGKVKGHGTTTEKHSYSFEDPKLKKDVTHYYRLKQVDFDGSYEYSEVKSVNADDNNGRSIAVYPNPVTEKLRFSIHGGDDSKEMKVLIRNFHGQVVYRTTHRSNQEGIREALNVQNLKAGQYQLSIREGDKVYRQKFIKTD